MSIGPDRHRVAEQMRMFAQWARADVVPDWASSLGDPQRQTARQAAAAKLRDWPNLNASADDLCEAAFDRVLNRLTKKGPFDNFYAADGGVNVDFVKNHFKDMIKFVALDLHRRQSRTELADDARLETILRQRQKPSSGTPSPREPRLLWRSVQPSPDSIDIQDGWQRVLAWLANRGMDDVRCPLHPDGCKDPDVILGAAVVHMLFLLKPSLEPAADSLPRLANPPKQPLDTRMYLLWQVVHPNRIRLEPDGTPSTAVTTAKGRMPFLCWLHLLDSAPDHDGQTRIRRQLETTLEAAIGTFTLDVRKSNTAANRNKLRVARLWRDDLG